MIQTLNIGMIGYKFMGKAHSHAWLDAPKFFDLKANPVMKVICGRDKAAVAAAARRWGWQHAATDYRDVVERGDVDIVDVTTPNDSHAEIAIAAAENGKHVVCEKPLAMSVKQALAMVKAVKKAGVKHMIWHNYRRVPAIALAKKLIGEGRLGKIYHVRAVYLQDWLRDPDFPLAWRMKKETAGSGAHGDLNAHLIDLARHLVGEFEEVVGMSETFVKERPIALAGGGLSGKGGRKKGKVTVDDAVLFLARLAGGVAATFEATRFAAGHKNGNRIEVNGSLGSLIFHFEDMNELRFFSAEDPKHIQGFKKILATESHHPYMNAYWPPGHIIGYEHTFVNQAADILNGIAADKPLSPDFVDGLRNQEVLEAVEISIRERTWVKIKKNRV